MSEKLVSRGEQLKIDVSEENQKNLERLQEKASQEHEQFGSDKIEKLQKTVEQQAVSAREVTIGEREEHSKAAGYVQKELKDTAYVRTLKRVRSQLNVPERPFSRLIHQPTVERLSNIGSKTVARPSGILAGGIFAVVGSTIALYMAKHYGFTYNYLLISLLFVGGFVTGILVELFIELLSKKPKY